MVDIYGDFDAQYVRLLRTGTRLELLDLGLLDWMFRQYSLGVLALRFVLHRGPRLYHRNKNSELWVNKSRDLNIPIWHVQGYTLCMHSVDDGSQIDWYKDDQIWVASDLIKRKPLRVERNGLRLIYLSEESSTTYWAPKFIGPKPTGCCLV